MLPSINHHLLFIVKFLYTEKFHWTDIEMLSNQVKWTELYFKDYSLSFFLFWQLYVNHQSKRNIMLKIYDETADIWGLDM